MINNHSGELVELDRRQVGWELRRVDSGSASAALPVDLVYPWWCRPGGDLANRPDVELGYMNNKSHPSLMAMKNQARDMGQKSGIPSYKLRPYWEFQVYRVRVPCRETADFEWHRTGVVVSLGKLRQLGKQFTAKQVYYVYRTLRIVA